MAGTPKFFKQVEYYFNKAAKLTKYHPGLIKQIGICNSVLKLEFPLERDDGSIEVIHA